ncbi:unnamed protein product [Polarella glacialis]|uniref:Uncharacterized protein n=1 Tax=Polarella glacialis TaxID=89957 RepID=A0A813KKC2_POLGL|nr:unnamed protein product [Polarella glacialis]
MQTKVSHFSVDLDHAAYVPFPKETTASDAAWTTSMDSAGTGSLAGVDAEALQFVSKNLDTLLKAEVPSSNAEEEEHISRSFTENAFAKQLLTQKYSCRRHQRIATDGDALTSSMISFLQFPPAEQHAMSIAPSRIVGTADMESSVGATPEKAFQDVAAVDAHFSVCGSPTPPEALSSEAQESQAVLREVATEAAAAALQLDVLGQVEADSDNLRKISHTTYKASEIAATESMFPGSEAGELAPFDITKTEVATEFLQGSETPGGVALFDFKIPEGSDAFGITKTEVATEFLQGSETPGEVALFDLKIPEGSDAFGITKTEVATEFLQGSETPGEVALFDLKIPEAAVSE